jgi:phosphoserine phosphatase
MSTQHWQLKDPINAVVFDCDGTLTSIEGIDELARISGVSEEVEALTAKAMGVSGINPELYQKRLKLTHPTQAAVNALGQHYFTHQVPDAKDVIRLLQRLHKIVYIVSAGLRPAVTHFGELLGIPSENIFAVDIQFDTNGHYVDFEKTSPLVFNSGKHTIVTQLKKQHPAIIHIGDGLNDFVTHDTVTRFVGYGGVYYRENMANCCDYYITSLSMSPLLALSLTEAEYELLTAEEKALYHKGLAAMAGGK